MKAHTRNGLSWYGLTVLFGIRNAGRYVELGKFLDEIIPEHKSDADNIASVEFVAFDTDSQYSENQRIIALDLLKYWKEKGCPGQRSNEVNLKNDQSFSKNVQP